MKHFVVEGIQIAYDKLVFIHYYSILYQISMVTHDPMTINKTKTKTFLKNDLFNQKKHNKPLQTHLSFTKGTQTRRSAIRYATRVVQSVAILKDQYIHIEWCAS